MKRDIVLAGVGGQGILTLAVLIVNAAVREGLNVRQAEVHGMSQRGGAVEAHVRLSDGPLFSNLVAKGCADLILATEPLEALRNIDYLSAGGLVVTNSATVENIPDYPSREELMRLLQGCGRTVYLIDAAAVAREAGTARAQNVVMIGAASAFVGLRPESLQAAVSEMFAKKKRGLVDMNLRALQLGVLRIQQMAPHAASGVV
jgi:indolepyruvate ferredoxin oxidoreductase beta subunit